MGMGMEGSASRPDSFASEARYRSDGQESVHDFSGTAPTLSPDAPGGVRESFFRGSGKGGQHRNKTETGVRLVHPSGIKVECCDERKREQNRVRAWAELNRRVNERSHNAYTQSVNMERNAQISERAWTWTQWRDEVVSPSGQRGRYSDLLKGKGFPKMSR